MDGTNTRGRLDMDPATFGYLTGFRPSDYVKGLLAESWEFADPSTYVVHLRNNVYWQNIPPVNGRRFTADDVVWHFHRMLGGGDGFTKPNSFYSTSPWLNIISITATDKYTVLFKWNMPSP